MPQETKEFTEACEGQYLPQLPPTHGVHSQSNPPRGGWPKHTDFLVVLLATTVSYRHLWTFPGMLHLFGGAVFLLAFCVALVLIITPLVYFHTALGQFSAANPVSIWQCCPALVGVGYGQWLTTAYVLVLFNYTHVLSLLHLGGLLQHSNLFHELVLRIFFNQPTCTQKNIVPQASLFCNESLSYDVDRRWQLNIGLMLVWTLVFASVARGSFSVAKMSYLLVFLSLTSLGMLSIMALIYPGAYYGLNLFLPRWSALLEPDMWFSAFKYAFFSSGVGYGQIMVFGSYSSFHFDFTRAVICHAAYNLLTLLLGTVMLLSVLGSRVFSESTLLVGFGRVYDEFFVHMYPQSLEKIYLLPDGWTILLFIMMTSLQLGNAIGYMETILAVIRDLKPSLRSQSGILACCSCLLFFSFGLIMTSPSSHFLARVIETWAHGPGLVFLSILNLVGVLWIYSDDYFFNDIHFLVDYRTPRIWRIILRCVTPLLLLATFIWMQIRALPYQNVPENSARVGWLMPAVVLAQIPGWYLWQVYRTPSAGLERWVYPFRPSPNYGPRDPYKQNVSRKTTTKMKILAK